MARPTSTPAESLHAQRATPGADLTDRYYRSALTALRFLDERSGRRRFGPDADARWRAFAGEDPAELRNVETRARVLLDADRIDLLLRDAEAQWPGGFGARVVFDLQAVAQDDAFGAEWTSVADGFSLWRDVSAAPQLADLPQLLQRLAAIWDTPLVLPRLPSPRPGSRWLLRGASESAAAILAFAACPGVVWHAQVIVVAGPPLAPGLEPRQRRHRALARQLAGLACGLLGQQQPTQLLSRAPAATDYPGHERFTSEHTEA